MSAPCTISGHLRLSRPPCAMPGCIPSKMRRSLCGLRRWARNPTHLGNPIGMCLDMGTSSVKSFKFTNFLVGCDSCGCLPRCKSADVFPGAGSHLRIDSNGPESANSRYRHRHCEAWSNKLKDGTTIFLIAIFLTVPSTGGWPMAPLVQGWLLNTCNGGVSLHVWLVNVYVVLIFTYVKKSGIFRDCLPHSLSFCLRFLRWFTSHAHFIEEPHRATGDDCHEAIGRAIAGAARSQQGGNFAQGSGMKYPNGLRVSRIGKFYLYNYGLKYVKVSIFHSYVGLPDGMEVWASTPIAGWFLYWKILWTWFKMDEARGIPMT